MNINTKVELVELYILNHKSLTRTMRAYKKKHRLIKDPFHVNTISRVAAHFFENGNLLSKPRLGRPPIRKEVVEKVKESVTKQPSTSIRKLSSETSTPASTVHNIMRRQLKLWPYKCRMIHALQSGDFEKRIEFSKWLLHYKEIIENVLWSDESYFSLDGVINRQNCRWWCETNPNVFVEHHIYSPKICVWFGFSAKFGVTPYFFDSTVTAEKYLIMLESHVIPELKRMRKLSSTYFMQDGAPPHFATKVRNFLLNQFNGRLISRGCNNQWPPRSPDLNPLDYWFWGWIKGEIYHHQKPQSLQQLKLRIIEICQKLTPQQLGAAVRNLHIRLQKVLDNDGGIIETSF